MLSVRGTVNQLPIKIKHVEEFIPLLNKARISYKFVGSLIGYFIYEFNDQAATTEALHLRDTIYKTNKL